MPKTVLITGASSGIGRAAALHFADLGWQVAATMRDPDRADAALRRDGIRVLRINVTDPVSIRAGVQAAIDAFGAVDVLVNNAGYGLMGPFEAMTREQAARQFDTNVFGLMEVTRAILPHFRERRAGVIVNLSSVVGRLGIPLGALYNASKWAVEGFSEALRFELEPLGIRVKIIEPGPIRTDFFGRSMDIARDPDLPIYDAYADRMLAALKRSERLMGSPPEKVARIIYRAATDGSPRLRYPAGGLAGPTILLRRLLPDALFRWFLSRAR